MGALKVANYQNIVEDLTSAQQQLVGISNYYWEATYEILRLVTVDPTIDLVTPLYNAYQASLRIYTDTPQSVVAAVRALQEHVLSRARTDENVDASGSNRFDSIDDWIDAAGTNGVGTNVGRTDDTDSSFKVSSEFAALSAQAGYAIDTDNIL